jgi:threonine aldolase
VDDARAACQRDGGRARARSDGGGLQAGWPVEANEVFAPITLEADKRLKAAGAMYYPWPSEGMSVGADKMLVRLVTSFQTTKDDVDRFLVLVGSK